MCLHGLHFEVFRRGQSKSGWYGTSIAIAQSVTPEHSRSRSGCASGARLVPCIGVATFKAPNGIHPYIGSATNRCSSNTADFNLAVEHNPAICQLPFQEKPYIIGD